MKTYATETIPGEYPPQDQPYHQIDVRFINDAGYFGEKIYSYWMPTFAGTKPGDWVIVYVPFCGKQIAKYVYVVETYDNAYSERPLKRAAQRVRNSEAHALSLQHGAAISALELQKSADNVNDTMKAYNDQINTYRMACNNTLNLPKEFIMKIETKVFVNNTDVTELSDDQLFGLIEKTEKEIERLKDIDHKPKKLTAKIVELQDSIKELVKLVDERS